MNEKSQDKGREPNSEELRLMRLGGFKRLADLESWLSQPPNSLAAQRSEPPDEEDELALRAALEQESDADVLGAAEAIRSELTRSDLSAPMRNGMQDELRIIEDELARRPLLKEQEDDYGKRNILFTKERAEAAKKRLRDKFGRITTGNKE